MTRRILVVEDDAALARVVRDNLAFEGFKVKCVADGDQAVAAVKEFAPDLVLLDVMLPGRSGVDLCGILRHGQQRTPFIFVTATVQKSDKLRGLKLGADDYVTKPFDVDELVARVHAVLRRARPAVDRLALGQVTIDFRALRAWRGKQEIHLTHREFELLQYLAERPGVVVHRDHLLRDVWGFADTPTTRAVDHAVARLRRKIEGDASHPRFIHTVHGDGYSLTATAPPTGRGRSSRQERESEPTIESLPFEKPPVRHHRSNLSRALQPRAFDFRARGTLAPFALR